MAITFELPVLIEQQLRGECVDFDAVAKEAALVELYRLDKLTHHQLATALGLDRLAVDEVLARHNVTEDLLTAEELGAQIATLRKLVAK